MKAKIQARIHSSKKTQLETVVPLDTPFSVHIDPCSICNFKCHFCFQADRKAIKKKGLKLGKMDMSLFRKIVEDLTAFPDRIRKVKLGLHGEPTMHPRLPDMIRYLKSKDVTDVIELFTNGALLSPDLNKAVVDAGLNRINISVEALTAEKYREVTGTNIDMNSFVSNIKDLYERRGECRIYMKIVNVNFTDEDKQLFFDTYGDICDEIYIENVVPQWAEINRLEHSTTGMYGQKIKRYKHVCPFLFMYLHFNYDGTTSGCTLDWGKEVLIGDITKERALDIWNGEKLKDLQMMHLDKRRHEVPFCNECLAPMVCVEDDLDDFAAEIREKIIARFVAVTAKPDDR